MWLCISDQGALLCCVLVEAMLEQIVCKLGAHTGSQVNMFSLGRARQFGMQEGQSCGTEQ
jgi:hypothetical protein